MTALKKIYCYQQGTDDCYKIGHTKQPPELRKRGFATGSSRRLTLRRTEKTQHHKKLENYIHQLLATKRAENGEFFFVTREEANAAFDQAAAFMTRTRQTVESAAKLKKQKPSGGTLAPTEETVTVYQELKSRLRDQFLLAQEIEFLESKLQLAIGGYSGIDGVATWEWHDSWNIDLKRFEREEPTGYKKLRDKYKRNSGSRRFVPAKGILTRPPQPQ